MQFSTCEDIIQRLQFNYESENQIGKSEKKKKKKKNDFPLGGCYHYKSENNFIL